MTEKEKGAVITDEPITRQEDDKLNYQRFADRVANCIDAYEAKEGFVLALYGAWGSGKTSVLNLVKESLINKQKPENAKKNLTVMEFNPWWFSGRENLLRNFFTELQNYLHGKVKKFVLSYGKRLLPDTVTLHAAASATHAAASATWDLNKATSLEKLKKDIDDQLDQRNQRIVVIIDDIDRLAPEEICELFRVIKAVANFNNIFYLLSFDPLVVKKAIKISEGMSGSAYLEKIIQAGFTMPKITHTIKWLSFVVHSIGKVMPEDFSNGFYDFSNRFNFYKNRLSYDSRKNTMLVKVFLGAEKTTISVRKDLFKHILQIVDTPRKIIKLSNALSFVYPVVKYYMRPDDILIMETLRVFCPEVYKDLYENIDILHENIDILRPEEQSSEEEQSEEKVLDEMMKRLHEPSEEEKKAQIQDKRHRVNALLKNWDDKFSKAFQLIKDYIPPQLIKDYIPPDDDKVNVFEKSCSIWYHKAIADEYFCFSESIGTYPKIIHEALQDKEKAQKNIQDLFTEDPLNVEPLLFYLIDYYKHLFVHRGKPGQNNYPIFMKAILTVDDHYFYTDGDLMRCSTLMAKLLFRTIELMWKEEQDILWMKSALLYAIKQGDAIFWQLLAILKIEKLKLIYGGGSPLLCRLPPGLIEDLKRAWMDRFFSELSKSKREDFINRCYFLQLLEVWGIWSEELDGNTTKAEQFIKDYKKDDKNWPPYNHGELTRLYYYLLYPLKKNKLLSEEICDSNLSIHDEKKSMANMDGNSP